ncbi:MAG TPA: excinuclease ABC subunit C, partial [Spirochaeta sp.]|nr:excinuclease ABC subunit C [Spirochaeta sp.]
VLTALGLDYIPLAGLAKRNEEIYLHGRSRPINLPEGDPALRVLQYVRDETHRFATGFNKKMRQKDSRFSILEGIPGIGPSKSRKLIQSFGSLEEIGRQSEQKLKEAAGLRSDSVKALLAEIHRNKNLEKNS